MRLATTGLGWFRRERQSDEARMQAYYTASQWQLIWWRFRKHRLAFIGAVVLLLLIFIGVFAEFVAPVSTTTRSTTYILGAPMQIHLVDTSGRWHLPFVYGVTTTRNPNTFRMEMQADTSVRYPVRLFVRGEPYRLWGLIDADLHLFGIDGGGTLHLFGTDDLGRDVFSRTVHATRISLSIGLLGTLLAFVLGVLIGGVSGYFGGWVDFGIQRFMEVLMSIPTLPFWLAVVAILPAEWTAIQTYFAITILLGLIGWTWTARRVRSLMLALREADYIVAARLSGNSHPRLILRHLLPSITSYLIVDLSIAFPGMILGETALSFLGLGLRPPVVSWGVLIQAAQNIRAIQQSPWLFIPVSFVILAVLAFNFLGDGLRDAADPYAQA